MKLRGLSAPLTSVSLQVYVCRSGETVKRNNLLQREQISLAVPVSGSVQLSVVNPALNGKVQKKTPV